MFLYNQFFRKRLVLTSTFSLQTHVVFTHPRTALNGQPISAPAAVAKTATCNENNQNYKANIGGLMVSVLDSGSKGPGWSTGWVIALFSWARYFILTVPLTCILSSLPDNLLIAIYISDHWKEAL